MTTWSQHTEPDTWPDGVIAYSTHGGTTIITPGQWTFFVIPDDDRIGNASGTVTVPQSCTLTALATGMSAQMRNAFHGDPIYDLAIAPYGSPAAAALDRLIPSDCRADIAIAARM
ncbi:hypothetical protein AB0D10_05205 [Kitasatospora sp. NPDC048545]|uniref:hypothetical protein n=1 Tax=Kitasatospora sp. NPDC048545 TaxID=3157208 RepID=UPI0033EC089E